jgi:hypothetical protein
VTVIEEGPRQGFADASEAETTTPAEGEDGAVQGDDDASDSTDTADAAASGDRVDRIARPDQGGRRSHTNLDAEIETLRQERSQYRLGGPITMLAIGSGVFLASAYLYVVIGAACYDTDCDRARTPFLVTGALGAGLGIWGGVELGNRIGPRRELGRRIKELERQKKGVDVSVTPVVTPSAAALQLNLVF